MNPPPHLRDFAARGLCLSPVGGRPPKTARDVAVFLADQWFRAGSQGKRAKIGQAVVHLWTNQKYTGISDPSHVTARKRAALPEVGIDATFLMFKGAGTTRSVVGEGAGALLLPASSMTQDTEGVMRFHGPVWTWAYGDETAEYFAATGAVQYRPKA